MRMVLEALETRLLLSGDVLTAPVDPAAGPPDGTADVGTATNDESGDLGGTDPSDLGIEVIY